MIAHDPGFGCSECSARYPSGCHACGRPSRSRVYTDKAVAYDKLAEHYIHEAVNHAEEYVKGRVHTNGLENFWSLLKRGLHGTYVAVEPFHLFRYLDEQVFRYNYRKTKDRNITDADRFNLALSHMAGSVLPLRK